MLIAAATVCGVLFWLSVAAGHSVPVLGLVCFGLTVVIMARALDEMKHDAENGTD